MVTLKASMRDPKKYYPGVKGPFNFRGGWGGWNRWGPSGGLGIVGLILIVMLLFYLFGGGPYFHRW